MTEENFREMYYTLLDILINGCNERTKQRVKDTLNKVNDHKD